MVVSLTLGPKGEHARIAGVLTGVWHRGSHQAAFAHLVGEPYASFTSTLTWG